MNNVNILEIWSKWILTICLPDNLSMQNPTTKKTELTKCLTKYVLTKCLPDKTSNKNP